MVRQPDVYKRQVLQVGAVTKGQQGKELSDIEGMVKAGIPAISEDGKSVMNAQLYREAMELAAKYNIAAVSYTHLDVYKRQILYGAQGAGKSTFFMKLCCNEDWYLENLKNINDKKDAAELIQGKLIAEFNELLAMKGIAGTEAKMCIRDSTYSDLFNFVIMLCAIITLVSNSKRKK